jgi:hypothetical protein
MIVQHSDGEFLIIVQSSFVIATTLDLQLAEQILKFLTRSPFNACT